jgi:hypothetical protein
MAAFTENVRRELPPSAMAANEGQRVDAANITLAGANAMVLDERAMQAMIARDA